MGVDAADYIMRTKSLMLLTEWLRSEDDIDIEIAVIDDMKSVVGAFLAVVVAPHVEDIVDTFNAYDIKTSVDLKLALGDIIMKVIAVDMADQLGV